MRGRAIAMTVRSSMIISWVRTALTMTARRLGCRVVTTVSSGVSCAGSVRSLSEDATEGVIETSMSKQSFSFVPGSLGGSQRPVNNDRFDLLCPASPILNSCHV